MQLANPYQQYKEQVLSTLGPGEILIKLYDELVKQMMIAKIKIDQDDFAAANLAFGKSQTIVTTLADSLDMQFPISGELRQLYIFFAKQLLDANLKKDVEIINDCIMLVKDLREAFSEANKITRRQQAGVGGRAV